MDAQENLSQVEPAPGPPALPKEEEPWAGCRVWRYFQPSLRAEMSCCLVETPAGPALIDPFLEMLPLLPDPLELHAILLTNGNHERAVHETEERFSAPVFAPLSAAAQHFEKIGSHWRDVTDKDLPAPLRCVVIPGFGPGESAFYDPRDGGALHVGDALIHLPDYGFAALPEKYCEHPEMTRQSLRAICSLPFERMTFAHGAPLRVEARKKLEHLLRNSGGQVSR